MEKMSIYLNSMKSGCFVLLTCLSLAFATTSCNNDDFELNEPEQQKQYTKAELIEQALSRMPRTRVNSNGVMMITIKDSVNIKVQATEGMVINWGDNSEVIPITDNKIYSHKYTDEYLSHPITLSGDAQALQSLNIDDNEVISLDIYSNENLTDLSCTRNHLDKLDLTGCPQLEYLYIADNEISFLEVSHLSSLFHLYAENNLLTAINVSENLNLFILSLDDNRIMNLDVSNNQSLGVLTASNNRISSLKLANSLNMVTLHVAFNPMTDLDLSESLSLRDIDLEGVALKTLNHYPISDTSFARYPILWQLNVAHTSFDSLDLSHNSMLKNIDISGSTITQLDISGLNIETLKATRSQLTNLIYGPKLPKSLYELRIENTPFEKEPTNMGALNNALPNRTGMSPGHLYTYSRYINTMISARNRNWVINQ
ncbi:MAG: hypothetical protein K2O69_02785 [Odoribacter sp.]|nr:hypothetical protein [Odoribacter sp.]